MRSRCPYCCATFLLKTPGGFCPECGRVMRTPNFFSRPKRKKPDAARRERREGAAWMDAGVWGAFLMGSPFKRAMFAIATVAVVGAFFFAPHQKPIDNDPMVLDLAHDNLATLAVALEWFRLDTGRFPLGAEGLTSLVKDPGVPGWKGPYIVKLKPDPWGREFDYRSNGEHVTLFSDGADGIPGTPDDILPLEDDGKPEPAEVEIARPGESKSPDVGDK